MDFTPEEKRILAMTQGDLPDSATPFADIAAACGTSEQKVLDLLSRLAENGVIRRFGASLAHNKAGWTVNAMVAWKATHEQAILCGAQIKDNPRVSHAYLRPSPSPEWPYVFYTMIHARSEAECEAAIRELAEMWRLEYAVLRTVRELKKTSPLYF